MVWVFWPFSLFFTLSLFLVMLWRTEYSIHLDASVCSSLGKSAMRIGKRPIQDGIETDGVCACCSGNGSGWAGQGFARFDEPAQPLHESQEIAGVFGRRHRKPDFGGR